MKTNTAGKWNRKCWGHATLRKVIPEGLCEEVTFQYRTQKRVIISCLLLQVSGIQQPSYPVLLEPPGWLYQAPHPHFSPPPHSASCHGTCRPHRESLQVASITEGLL